MSIQRIKSGVIADSAVTAAKLDESTSQLFGMRNRIINGDCRIDQRNAGAAVTITDTSNFTYTLDRWAAFGNNASKFSVQQVTDAPATFVNSLKVTSLAATSLGASDQYSISQQIEGLNVADLGWGTASAKTVTLSFWVRSSLTGTFGGAFTNSALNRGYGYTYTISSANTWEQKLVTIPGDTSGTWLTTNGVGIRVYFGLGVGSTLSVSPGAWTVGGYRSATGATSVVGTDGATFYITGVQLEVGSVATPFERRPFGTELFLCYRYFQKSFAYATSVGEGKSEYGNAGNTTNYATAIPYIYVKYPVQLRTTPGTVTLYNPRSGGTAGQITNSSNDGTGTAVVNSAEKGFMVQANSQGANNWYIHWGASAEL